ncbi:MAG TPA: mechanosensitive ion channel family protein [Candidatus Krumholzibacteria bacterium]|nr:mechanosensitive ion channel family protein [Candidatus Krumholzibacteria bacterium]HPD70255.1 mechanosensitive ion channel family protein [Candidatus Krumholzibacteria bacterium]HRY40045.1 mechanosensitive ion channel family protein [Candidatus Krumholzibacteria bacterium]
MDLPTVMFYGNPVRAWLIALAIAVVLTLAAKVVVYAVIRRLRRLADRTENQVDDLVIGVLERTKLFLLSVLAVYAGASSLVLPPRLGTWIGTIAVFALLLQAGFWADRLINLLILKYQEKNLETDAGRVTTMRATGFLVRLVVFSVIALMALDNVPGLDITTLIAGLGVGGIAVALALQNVLGDLFASLSIALDKPFVIGDFIVLDTFSGTVEQIGLKTTRVRSISGEQLIFSNNDLLASRIRNFRRMTERRSVFNFGVTYQTSPEKLAAIPVMLREIIAAQPNTRFDRAHFKGFAPSSLDFEAVYFVLQAEYGVFMDVQQAINLDICRRFAAEGIEFAYPTQTVYVRRGASGEPARDA